jgi:hypothetical protein
MRRKEERDRGEREEGGRASEVTKITIDQKRGDGGGRRGEG